MQIENGFKCAYFISGCEMETQNMTQMFITFSPVYQIRMM